VIPFVCRHTTQAPPTIISRGLGDRTARLPACRSRRPGSGPAERVGSLPRRDTG
jgi:hypothetical protein